MEREVRGEREDSRARPKKDKTEKKTGLGGERRTKCAKVKRRQGGGGGGTTPEERERKGSKRAGPIKRSCGCNCSTYSQQILICGGAIKLILNLWAAPPPAVITFMGPQ